jgi:hypothetical protein
MPQQSGAAGRPIKPKRSGWMVQGAFLSVCAFPDDGGEATYNENLLAGIRSIPVSIFVSNEQMLSDVP